MFNSFFVKIVLFYQISSKVLGFLNPLQIFAQLYLIDELGRVAQWDSALHSELEGSCFESHCCTWQGFGTQPYFTAPGNLWVELEIAL